MIHAIHHVYLRLGQSLELALVLVRLKGKPDHAAERHDRRLELVAAVVCVVVPRHGDVRRPKQEGQDPQILMRQEPVAPCNAHGEQDALDVEGEGSIGENTACHSYNMTRYFCQPP